MAKKLKITWVKSRIGTQQQHRGTIRALGLHRLNQSVIQEDAPVIRGMIHAVDFMVRVEEMDR